MQRMDQPESLQIAIIGGSGFIGNSLVKIIRNKHKNICVIDKKDIDLSLDRSVEDLRQRLIEKKIDTAIILAAVKRQDGDSKDIFNANNQITNNISRSIQDLNCKVVYYSSCAVYGEKNEQVKVNENHKFQPTSYYGEHKVFSEEIYKKELDEENLLIVRPPLIYDWQQQNGYQPGGFLARAIKTGKIFLWGDGQEKREFIHVKDAAEVTKSLIMKKCNGDVILASGISYSYRSISENIQKITNCQIFEKERTGAKVDHSYSNAKLTSMIGKFDFREPFIEEKISST